MAAADPAGPAPTTTTSQVDDVRLLTPGPDPARTGRGSGDLEDLVERLLQAGAEHVGVGDGGEVDS